MHDASGDVAQTEVGPRHERRPSLDADPVDDATRLGDVGVPERHTPGRHRDSLSERICVEGADVEVRRHDLLADAFAHLLLDVRDAAGERSRVALVSALGEPLLGRRHPPEGGVQVVADGEMEHPGMPSSSHRGQVIDHAEPVRAVADAPLLGEQCLLVGSEAGGRRVVPRAGGQTADLQQAQRDLVGLGVGGGEQLGCRKPLRSREPSCGAHHTPEGEAWDHS